LGRVLTVVGKAAIIMAGLGPRGALSPDRDPKWGLPEVHLEGSHLRKGIETSL
jgi:hypothetical protein